MALLLPGLTCGLCVRQLLSQGLPLGAELVTRGLVLERALRAYFLTARVGAASTWATHLLAGGPGVVAHGGHVLRCCLQHVCYINILALRVVIAQHGCSQVHETGHFGVHNRPVHDTTCCLPQVRVQQMMPML